MEHKDNFIRIDPIIIFMLFLQVIFIIFATITIKNILHEEVYVPKITISNYSDIPEGSIIDGANSSNLEINFTIDDEKKTIIEGVLYNEVSLNNINDIPNFGAVIRQGSVNYVYISDLEIYLLNFIVDIEELGQSYRVVYRWADKYPNENAPVNTSIIALCPLEHELIYGDFNCKDNYNGNGEDVVVYELLVHKKFNNFTVGHIGDVYNGDKLELIINDSSSEESVKKNAVAKVADYLNSLGFNLEDFKYTINSGSK